MTNRARILYNNVADDYATIAASSEASGSTPATNLVTEYKSEVWRATGKTSETLTLTWAAAQNFSMAALVFANLSPTATVKVEVFTLSGDSVPVLDTGDVAACAYMPLGTYTWGALPLGVNAFSYGGYTYARVYFASTSGKKVRLTIKDPSNTAAYVEAARIVLGDYWSPAVNPGWGAGLDFDYGTKHRRTDAGDLRTELRPISRSLKLQFDWLTSEEDRARFYEILVGNGMSRPLFVSLFPEDVNPAREQSYQIYGKLGNNSGMSHPRYGVFAAPLVLDEA